jgi:phage/plasmid-like protein (TIGR03299 family)
MTTKTVDVNAKTVEDAFEQSGLLWAANQAEMINSANGKVIEGKKVIYRDDNNEQLGVVGTNYGVIQNSDCFSFFNTICKDHKANIVKVNEYKGGALIHLEAKVIDKSFEVRKGDECGFKFDLWNSFDGLSKASVAFGVVRLVCTNGLVAFDANNSNSVAIKHTKSGLSRMEQALRVWNGGESWLTYFKETTMKLNQKMVDKKMVDAFLDEIYGKGESKPTVEKKETTKMLFETGKGNGKGTAWDLLNGVTEYIDHYSKKDSGDRLEFANSGIGYNIKARAFNLLTNISK